MQLNEIINLIGILLPLVMLIIAILAIIYNVNKLNRIKPVNYNNVLDSDGRNMYDPNSQLGKNIITEQNIILKIISYFFGAFISVGFFIQIFQLFYFSSPIKTEKLIKTINNHGEILYVNKAFYDIGLSLWIIGFVGLILTNIVRIRMNRKK